MSLLSVSLHSLLVILIAQSSYAESELTKMGIYIYIYTRLWTLRRPRRPKKNRASICLELRDLIKPADPQCRICIQVPDYGLVRQIVYQNTERTIGTSLPPASAGNLSVRRRKVFVLTDRPPQHCRRSAGLPS